MPCACVLVNLADANSSYVLWNQLFARGACFRLPETCCPSILTNHTGKREERPNVAVSTSLILDKQDGPVASLAAKGK